MKLHDLSAVPGSTKFLKELVEVMAPVKVKLLVKATKVKKQDQAQAFARVLKAAKCLCKDVYLKEVSTTFSRKKSSLSM